jgi:hypothetical protein
MGKTDTTPHIPWSLFVRRLTSASCSETRRLTREHDTGNKKPADLSISRLFCNPAEVQTELARTGDFLSFYRNQRRRINPFDFL